MTKFKVGDRVRLRKDCTSVYARYYTEGKIYKVVTIPPMTSPVVITDNGGDEHGSATSHNFEIAYVKNIIGGKIL